MVIFVCRGHGGGVGGEADMTAVMEMEELVLEVEVEAVIMEGEIWEVKTLMLEVEASVLEAVTVVVEGEGVVAALEVGFSKKKENSFYS